MVQVTPASEGLRCLEIYKAEIAMMPSLRIKVAGVDRIHRKSKLKDARNVSQDSRVTFCRKSLDS